MPSYSALELVNDYLRLGRHDTVESFGESKGIVALQQVNDAIDSVLNDQDWDFAHRHDGVLYTYPKVAGIASTSQLQITATGTTGDVLLSGTTGIIGSGLWDVSRFADPEVSEPIPCLHVSLAGDASLETSGYKVYSLPTLIASPGYPTGSGDVICKLHQIDIDSGDSARLSELSGHGWKGSSYTLASGDLTYEAYCHEFWMPEHVRAVTTARMEGSEIGVHVVGDSVPIERLAPRPWDDISDSLCDVWVGGFTSYSQLGWKTSETALRMVLSPTPDRTYKLDYSYIYRFPHLVETSDTIQISTSARSKLVKWAYHESNMTQIGGDPEAGAFGKRDVREAIAMAKGNTEPARGGSYGIKPYRSTNNTRPNGRWDKQIVGE